MCRCRCKCKYVCEWEVVVLRVVGSWQVRLEVCKFTGLQREAAHKQMAGGCSGPVGFHRSTPKLGIRDDVDGDLMQVDSQKTTFNENASCRYQYSIPSNPTGSLLPITLYGVRSALFAPSLKLASILTKARAVLLNPSSLLFLSMSFSNTLYHILNHCCGRDAVPHAS